MYKELEIRTLTERFFDGLTTLAEERRLYELYGEAEGLPADLLPLREMMLDLQRLDTSRPTLSRPTLSRPTPLPLPVREGSDYSFQQYGHSTPLPHREGQGGGSAKGGSALLLSLAASLLLLFTLGSMWYGYERQNQCVAYVYGERVTDPSIVLQEMQTALASIDADEATATMEQQMKELFAE